MNTVIDLKNLSARVVFERSEIDRLRWFQTVRYFESGLVDELPTQLPNDRSVDLSTYFGVYRGDEICATARLISATAGLPTLEHHQLYPASMDRISAVPGSVLEMSRLAIARKAPHFKTLALLSREFLRFIMGHPEANLLIGSVEKPLVPMLSRLLDMPVQIIGPPIEQFGTFNGECVPILIDALECLQQFRQPGSRRGAFFMEDLVMDLTADVSHDASLDQAASL